MKKFQIFPPLLRTISTLCHTLHTMFFPGILIPSRKKIQNLPASPGYIQYLIFVPRVHTCQTVDQDVCLNRLSVHKHRRVQTLILRIGVASSLGALWELSGSSLGALWELVAVAGITINGILFHHDLRTNNWICQFERKGSSCPKLH